MKIKLTIASLLVICSQQTFALEDIVGKVTTLEPSYMPNTIAFIMDNGNSTCQAGRWFYFVNNDQEKIKTIYSTLMTALVSGKNVRFHIADGDTNCYGVHLHLLQ